MPQDVTEGLEDQAAVVDAEERRRAALVAVDIDALDALFDPELVHIHSNGMVHDKQSLLHHIRTRRAFISIDRGPLNVRIRGDTAVVVGRMTNLMRLPDGETITLEGMVTQVLRRVAGTWRFVNFQFTLA